MEQKPANRLIKEASPYLQQHAHNPVDWFPWGDGAWEKARKENKPVLVSIGYSACHWCHVMERESFEDDAVAKVMNENFICIKVDREERPDVDQVYMSAVQLMTGGGGWPLNCFTLPDGRPVYGGTYFPKQNWLNLLHTLASIYKNEPQKVLSYADELTLAVSRTEQVPAFAEKKPVTKEILEHSVEEWEKRFDNEEGGPQKAPKFPLPNNYQFLLRHYYFFGNEDLLKHIELTLEKMAFGGIYDQAGGGFARYSTDAHWKIPHFEKMLYDNAQLVSLYSEAYQLTKNSLYKEVVYETLEFIEREMTSPEGGFYSALDADSEGEEGKYYVWTKSEFRKILSESEDFEIFCEYFNVTENGNWENGNNILLRKKADEEIAGKFSLTAEALRKKIRAMKKKVLTEREKRIKPGLDHKILASWNGLMLKGYSDAYAVFHEEKFLQAANRNAEFILVKMKRQDSGLIHSQGINGFLEDYAFVMEAFLSLYQCSFEEKWLHEAEALAAYCLKYFYDEKSCMFYFTSSLDAPLIARKMEIHDNVIPSSNSSLARSLFCLSRYFDEPRYEEIAGKMLQQVQEDIPKYGSGFSNWAMLAQHFIYPFHEIVIVGNSVNEKKKALSERFIPDAIFAGSSHGSSLPLLQNRFAEGKTLIYICKNKTCRLPVENINEALEQLG